ncbi:MAG TPA: hypothetical protein VMP89_03500 [Solirubrobacteraceae bacterium]|jgi:hypothetical protein|nr:hypothetical protein [Solirubrobacteraceae bacterium]
MASHVTDDLSAETIALSRDELCERMSSNLGRCGAHNGIAAAIAATVSWWATKFGFRLARSSDDWQTGGVRPSRESLWPTLAAGLCPSKESERGGYGGY